MSVKPVFRYPHPVNEVTARLVAAMVVVLGGSILTFDQPGLLPLLVYGFAARVLNPILSPMSLLASRVLVPALGNPRRPAAGPPKRFAQAVGLAVSAAALVLWTGLEEPAVGRAFVGVLVGFAALEAALGFCAGCLVFNHLMRWGWIPPETCERCANLRLPARRPA